jgi:hypothetical protein
VLVTGHNLVVGRFLAKQAAEHHEKAPRHRKEVAKRHEAGKQRLFLVEVGSVSSITLPMPGRPLIPSSPLWWLTSLASANSITLAPLGSNHFTLMGITTG